MNVENYLRGVPDWIESPASVATGFPPSELRQIVYLVFPRFRIVKSRFVFHFLIPVRMSCVPSAEELLNRLLNRLSITQS